MKGTIPQGRVLTGALLAVGLGLCHVGGAWPDRAAAAATGKIGYFDYKRVLEQATIGREAVKRIEAEQAQATKDIEALEKEQQAIREALTSKEPTKAPLEEVKKRQETLRLKIEELNQKKVERPQQREQQRGKIQRELRDTVKAVVDEYAKEQGFALIFNRARGNIFYGEKELDVTDAIIERLNRKASAGSASAPTPEKP